MALSVAIMQPYFMPYAGYFRLLAASDLFVVYDCVQFPRRGWVHRNRLISRSGVLRWLTLPLAHSSLETLIRDVRFVPDAQAEMSKRLRAFHLTAAKQAVAEIIQTVRSIEGSPVEYVERLLRQTALYLGLPWRTIRSSSLDVPASMRGQARILEIARSVGASRYINPAGGRLLYDPAAFAEAGIELRFLSPYNGPACSILGRMIEESASALASDIRSSTVTSA